MMLSTIRMVVFRIKIHKILSKVLLHLKLLSPVFFDGHYLYTPLTKSEGFQSFSHSLSSLRSSGFFRAGYFSDPIT